MPEITSLLGTAIKLIQEIRKTSKKIESAPLHEAIADLQIAIADIKIEVAGLKDENLRLKQELKAAAERPDFRQLLERREDGAYYFSQPPAGYHEGPYCPTCFDSAEKLITLSRLSDNFSAIGNYRCGQCNTVISSS